MRNSSLKKELTKKIFLKVHLTKAERVYLLGLNQWGKKFQKS